MIVEDSELRGVITLRAMEALTRLVDGQVPHNDIDPEGMGAILRIMTAAVREAVGPETGCSGGCNDHD